MDGVVDQNTEQNSEPKVAESYNEMDALADLEAAARQVLHRNDQGRYTIPAGGLYPHQWLWDSCFISIGLRHYDVGRAQQEILSLMRGQWSNGMLPHMIFSGDDLFRRDHNIWRSWVSPYAPDDIFTSGFTQPPILAEAIVQVGKKLSTPERRSWYQTTFPALVKYHQWLFEERDPRGSGLVFQVHPYETGLDSTPPWIHELHRHHFPWWAKAIHKTRLDNLANLVRRDTRRVPPGQRMNNIDAILYYDVVRNLRNRQYDIKKILKKTNFLLEDLTFNSIFIRANQHLQDIAKTIRRELPDNLQESIKNSQNAIEQLWDAYSSQYYSRNYKNKKLVKEPSLATLMPLYAGSISKERAEQLVKLLDDPTLYGPPFPVPSVAVDSTWFKSHGYWQGPTWLNTNWLVIDGLRRYGFKDKAEELADKSLSLVAKQGMYEYFSPIDGSAAGAKDFSWTAALALDLMRS